MLFGRHAGLCPGITPLGNIGGLESGNGVAVTVELETPFVFVVPLLEGVKWEDVRREGGRRKKDGREE